VAKSQADKAAEYVSYAEHCLKIAWRLPDQESRIVHREMAAEWIRLAGDAAGQDAYTKYRPRLVQRRPIASQQQRDGKRIKQ